MKNALGGWRLFIVILAFLAVREASAGPTGPVYPPPGGVTFSSSGSIMGLPGGVTWHFTNTPLAATNVVFWGASNNGVAMSFNNPGFSGPGEIMTLNPALSSLANGKVVWTGQTFFPGGGGAVNTECIMTVSNAAGTMALPLINPTNVGLPANVGGLLTVTSNLGWQVNLQMLANGNPAIPFFDTYHAYPYNFGGEDYSSFTGGFYYDTPPQLQVNAPLAVNRGQTNVVSSNLLFTSSVEVGPSGLIYTIPTGNQGGPPHAGTLKLNGTGLTNGSTFTQADINAGNLTYVQDGDCSTSDNFTFNVNDGNGGYASDQGFTNFDFQININHPNQPPVTYGQSISVPLGAMYAGTLMATDYNCTVLPLTYRITASPTKGTVSITNTNTGAFTYTATLGQSGADSFSFQANNGIQDAVTPGVVSVIITNQPPTVQNGSGSTAENVAFNGQFTAADPDQPPATLTYSIVGNGSLGTAVLTGTNTGTFVYTPNPGAFGYDTISFQASYGGFVSPTGTFSITIRPALAAGRVIVSDSNIKGLIELDLNSRDYYLLSQGNLLQQPQAVAIEPTGNILVGDATNGLVRVNPATGAQTLLAGITNFPGLLKPSGIAIEPGGTVLVTDGSPQVQRFDPVTGSASVVSTNSPGDGSNFFLPLGVALGSNGNIYVSDGSGFYSQQGRIIEVNPGNGVQTLLTAVPPMLDTNGLRIPAGIVVTSSNKIYVTDISSAVGSPPDKLYAVDEFAGTTTLVSSNGLSNYLSIPFGLAITPSQLLVVANNTPAPYGLLTVYAPADAQMPLPYFPLPKPFGVAVVRQQPVFTAIKPQHDGSVLLDLSAEAGRFVAIQYSADLTTWNGLAGVPTPTGVASFTDTNAIGQPFRFYRAFTY